MHFITYSNRHTSRHVTMVPPICPETETLGTELLQQNVFTGETLFAMWWLGLAVKALHTALTDRLK